MCQDNLIKKKESFQQIVPDTLDIHMQKKEIDDYFLATYKKVTQNGSKN